MHIQNVITFGIQSIELWPQEIWLNTVEVQRSNQSRNLIFRQKEHM